MGEGERILKAGCACFCCAGVITLIILIAVSFSTLEATEMGLDYSSVSKSFDHSKIYASGRHMLGVGHSFIKFPKDQQTTKFPGGEYSALVARTLDGLSVSLDVSYQYRLKADVEAVIAKY